MLLNKLAATVVVGAGLVFSGAAHSEAVKIKLEPYVTGLNSPLAMVQPDGDERKFVIEQFGRVRVINAAGELVPIHKPCFFGRRWIFAAQSRDAYVLSMRQAN